MEFNQYLSILCGNASIINNSKNHVMNSITKQIPIKYHFIRWQAGKNVVKLDYVATKEQIEDIFTKPLPSDIFEYLRRKLGVVFVP